MLLLLRTEYTVIHNATCGCVMTSEYNLNDTTDTKGLEQQSSNKNVIRFPI